MNKVILMGRLTRDPEVRYAQGQTGQFCSARYSIAVDRPVSRNNANNGEATADFIECQATGQTAEFVEKYLHKGTKIMVEGRLQNNNYTKQDGTKVYSYFVKVDRHEFCESKGSQSDAGQNFGGNDSFGDGFTNIPGGSDDEVPF